MSQTQATFIEGHILRRFNVIKKVGSGAYGHVWKVEEKATKKVFALKKIFDAFQHATDAQRTYREIQILRQTDHPNIIKLHDTMRAENNKDVYLLFEFMEADLHNVISQGILKDVHIRFIVYQLAKALKYLHSGKIIHRDLKPSNILVNSNCTIKLCDFGLVRSLLPSIGDHSPVLTQGVATRWYRAPEVLLGSKSYSTPADIWSFGCIIYEIIAQKPIFAGTSTLDQIQKICSFTGYPSEEDINALQSQISRSMIKEIKVSVTSKPSNYTKDLPLGFADLLQKIIVFNPQKRITIEEILNHQIVKSFHKPEEEISCEKEICTSIDDNKKFSVDEYRKLIYGVAPTTPTIKTKTLSTSLGSGSSSLKYFSKPVNLNGSTSNLQQTKTMVDKPDLAKKYSYEKFKSVNLSGTQLPQKESQVVLDQKKFEKQTLKYVKSAKDINTNQNGAYQQYQQQIKQNILNKEEEIDQNMTKPSNFESQNKMSSNTYISKTFYSPKNIEQKQTSMHSSNNSGAVMTNMMSGTWKSPTNQLISAVSPKDSKMQQPMQQQVLFKAPKVSSINKTETKPVIYTKYEQTAISSYKNQS